MSDNENKFERLIMQFSVKYGRLRIGGYHGKQATETGFRSVGRNESLRHSENVNSGSV